MALTEPVPFAIQPAIKGLNTDTVATDIDMQESPALMNVRFTRGQIATRNGFKGKYFGAYEPILLSDYVWTTSGGSSLIALTRLMAYFESSTKLKMLPIFKGDSGTLTIFNNGNFAYFGLLSSQWFSIDVGKVIYNPQYCSINSGAAWPGSGDYADTTFLCCEQGVKGIFILINGSQGPEGQVLTPVAGDTVPATARAIATMDGRVILGGPKGGAIQLYSYVQWSAKGDVSKWSSANGGGGTLVGDDAEYIQALAKLGEYLLVYKEGSVHIGKKTFLLDPVLDFSQLHSIGLAAPKSIGDMGTQHIFLGWDNVYILDLTRIKSVADKIKQELLYGPDGITQKYYANCFGTTAAEFDEYWLFVPTGKIPEYVDGTEILQLAQNPTMEHERIEGTVSTASADLTSVITESGDTVPNRVTVGDMISGWGLTSDRQVTVRSAGLISLSGGNGNRSIVASKFLVIPSGTGLTYGWEALSGNLTVRSGGNFGGQYAAVTFGALPTFRNRVVIDLLTGDFHEPSMVVWMKGDTPTNVTIFIDEKGTTNWADAPIASVSRTVTLTTSWQPFIISMKYPGAYRYCGIRVVGQNGGTIYVDAVEVIDLYKSSSSYVEDKFVYTENPYRALGFIGPDGSPQLIPMVVDKIAGYMADTVWVYNYANDSWTKWRLPVTGQGWDTTKLYVTIADLQGLVSEQTWRFDEKLVAEAAPSNLLGGLDGQFYEISKKYDTDWQNALSRPLLSYWQSKDFTMGQPYLDKTLSRIVIYHEQSHPAVSVEVGASTDSGASWTVQTVTIRTGHNETFADFFVVGTQIRFRIKASMPFAVSGWSVKIIARGEANAY